MSYILPPLHPASPTMGPTSSIIVVSPAAVLIAAAGGAAHLPGMAASHTSLPVIGVPVKPTIGDGTDSLLSMTNMPRGVPVATVGVNNSINAAILAARIIGVSDLQVRQRLEAYVQGNADESLRRDKEMVEKGWQKAHAEWFPAK